MAVDITLLFKASVKTVKTRNKAIGIGFDSTKDEIFKRSRPKNSFAPKAKEVVSVPKLTVANRASIPTNQRFACDCSRLLDCPCDILLYHMLVSILYVKDVCMFGMARLDSSVPLC